MSKIKLARSEYYDKVLACWLGKNIGGTLGTPYEGQKFVHCLNYFDPVPEKPLPNDDLDFQLVWLKMLEDRGVKVEFSHFVEHWLKYLSNHWYAEYSVCLYNLLRGLRPPISGTFQNYWVDEMGAPIRSEIWACVAPGDPQLAATLAWMDSCLDHAGGEGQYGEMFWAAVESAAFFIKDPDTLIQIGLSMIPTSSNIYRVIKEAVLCYKNGMKWDAAREHIVTLFGHHQPCNAIPNHGFIILGWLYGKDYGDKLCKAVNCGYDTDCTGATLGSLLGILYGTAGIPEEWLKPVGREIILVPLTGQFNHPKTVDELAERTVKVGEKFLAENSQSVEIAEQTQTPPDLLSLLFRNDKPMRALCFDIHSAVEKVEDIDVVFYYNGEPTIMKGIEKVVGVSLLRKGEPLKENIEVEVPKGWRYSEPKWEIDRWQFVLYTEDAEPKNEITIKCEKGETKFVILSADSIKPLPAAQSAPRE
ncbi:ADP-ribosylglycohydrolase family protein [bacterium]|nr:ADP-ribosylglycohydrolase family protein [bacterium]